ncbi:MAG: alpha/beta hydrolase [Solirubrobacteraceae bacterium]
MKRSEVTFSLEGTDCAGWLYRPAEEGKTALVVMAHGFSCTREMRLPAYAQRFCAAGLGVLLFDYRHFGASGGEPRQLLDIAQQHADYRAAVRYARGLDWVDPNRVALFGSSFSGGHVLVVAAHDPRIAAVVSQGPYTDSLASLPTLGALNIVKATVAGLWDQLGALLGRPPYYIPAVSAPHRFALMSTPDSQPGFDSLLPANTRWENRVAARIAVRIVVYRPGRCAARVACPTLFCVCDHDAITPAGPTLKFAAKAPRGEVRRYPIGHFEIYVGDTWERAIADQTEFLVRHLGGSAQRAN